MPERGGPSTQSGIYYQNTVSVLYLGQLCEGAERPDVCVVRVRVEAPSPVGDLIVTYKDGRRVFIEVKENVEVGDQAWIKLLRNFEAQFWGDDFNHGTDRLLLFTGGRHLEHIELRDIGKIASNSESHNEWLRRLNKAQHRLVKKVKALFEPRHGDDREIHGFFQHILVEIYPSDELAANLENRLLPESTKPRTELLRLLRDRVADKARWRGTFTKEALLESLAKESGVEFTAGLGDAGRPSRGYINPRPVFERVGVADFRGREWLDAKVDDFLGKEERGYFIIEAKAGIGKTIYLAHLVLKREKYLHHFAELAGGAEACARNLSAQLAGAWELERILGEIEVSPPASRYGLLQDLLFAAAEKRDRESPGEKIVLVVDALNEGETPPGQNVLGLPKILPKGVYFIVSQRPGSVTLTTAATTAVETIEASGSPNLADMSAYLEQASARPRVREALRRGGKTAGQFVETLLNKSQGVWVYLHFVLHDLERGEDSPLNFDELPEGLWRYYAQHFWRRRSDAAASPEHWYALHLPLLGTLAAVEEPVSLELLRKFAGVGPHAELKDLLGGWMPFIYRDEQTRAYRLYHASLREFLSGPVEHRDLREHEREMAREMADATCRTDSRISDLYLSEWGGLEVGLPGLREPAKHNADGGYGLRNLTKHLKGAGRVEELHRLLCVGWRKQDNDHSLLTLVLKLLFGERQAPSHENAWYAAHEHVGDITGYVRDVSHAWQTAEETSRISIGDGELSPDVGLEVRYALIAASVNSVAGNIPPRLLHELIARGQIAPAHGLAYALRIPDPTDRLKALLRLVPQMPEHLQPEVFHAVSATARGIREDALRAIALAYVASNLPDGAGDEMFDEALAALSTVRPYKDEFARALKVLAERMPESVFGRVLAFARSVEGIHGAKALAILLPHVPEPLKETVSEEILASAHKPIFSGNDYPRVELLKQIAPYLSELQIHKALEYAGLAEDEKRRAEASALLKVYLALMLPDASKNALLCEVLHDVKNVLKYAVAQAEVITSLTEHLPESLLDLALGAARKVRGSYERAASLTALAPRLPRARRDEVLVEVLTETLACEWSDEEWCQVVADLMPQLSTPLLRTALQSARKIDDEEDRAVWLFHLAPHIAGSLVPRALEEARSLRDRECRASALAFLAMGINGREKGEAAGEALDEIAAITDQGLRATLLDKLAPYLDEPLLPRARLLAFRFIGDEGARVMSLTALASRLPKSFVKTLIDEAVRHIKDPEELAETLSLLTPHLSRPLRRRALKEALKAIEQFYLEDRRAQALTALAPDLPDSLHGKAWTIGEEISNASIQADALTGLASYIPKRMLPRAVAAVSTAPFLDHQVRLLNAVAPRLTSRLQLRVLNYILTKRRGEDFTALAAALAPHLPSRLKDAVVNKALTRAREIDNAGSRVQALVALIPLLSGAQGQAAIEEAFNSAQQIQPDRLYVEQFKDLVPLLPEHLHGQAVGLAKAAARKNERAMLLAMLAPHLSEPARIVALEASIEALKAPPDFPFCSDGGVAEVLVALAPYLPGRLLHEGLNIARGIKHEEERHSRLTLSESKIGTYFWKKVGSAPTSLCDRAEALVALAEYLPSPQKEEVLGEAFRDAQEFSRDDFRSRVLGFLAPHLSESLALKAFEAVQTLDCKNRGVALTALAPRLAAISPASLHPYWSSALRLMATRSREELLADVRALAPIISSMGGHNALTKVIDSIRDVSHWWP